MELLKQLGAGLFRVLIVLLGMILVVFGSVVWMSNYDITFLTLANLGAGLLVGEVIREDALKLGVKRGQFKGMMDVGPWGWFILTVLMTIPAILLYLYQRPKYVSAEAAVDTVECPLCKEPIKAHAVKCRWCGSDVAPAREPIV